MNHPTQKLSVSCLMAILAGSFLCGRIQAADILEATTGGASGTDWNQAAQWIGGAVPTTGNNYVVNTTTAPSGGASYYGVSFGTGYIRTPANNSASVFLGDSLILPLGTQILLKETSGGSARANIVFTNYNQASTAGLYPLVRLGPSSSGGTATLTGTITNLCDSYVANDAGGVMTLVIVSTVAGVSNLTLVSASGGTFAATRTNSVTGDWSGFTGTLNVGNTTAAGMVVLNCSAVNVNLALALPRTNAILQLEKWFAVRSLTITNKTVPAGTYTPAQLVALGFGGNFYGSGSLTVGFTAPPTLTAAPGNAQVALAWRPVYGAASYNVKRSTTSGAETTLFNVSGTNYTDTSAANGTQYYYQISAVDAGSSESGNSVEASATPVAGPPTAPTWEYVTAGSPAQVSLRWTSGGGTMFFLKRGTVSGTYDVTNIMSATNYVDTQVLSGTTYYYAVSATNIAGASADSVEMNVTPNAAPFAPTGLTAVNTGEGALTLTWNSTFGATSYNVKRSTSSGAEVVVGTAGSASYADSGLVNGTTYYYQVSAVGAGGESTDSAEVSIVPGFVLEVITGGASGTDWNQGSQWNGGNVPGSGASYVLNTNTTSTGSPSYYGVSFGLASMRTPANGSASIFLGPSLIMPPGTQILLKETSGGSASANILFTNYNSISTTGLYPLIRLAPNTSGGTVTLNGTITNLFDSYIANDAGATMTLKLAATVAGTKSLTLVSANGPSGGTFAATRTNLVTGNWSGFDGTLNIGNATVGGVVELNNAAVNPKMTLTMLNTNGGLILDKTITVLGFSIGGSAVANGAYSPADLLNLGYGGNFAGTGLLIVDQVPTVANSTYARNGLNAWKISVSDLLVNATDPDGDALTVTAVGTSTNGATLTLSGGYVLYSNPNLVDDQFTYTVSDVHGGSSTGVVTLTAGGVSGMGGQVSSLAFTGGTASMSFAGIPGYKYQVQVTTSLSSPVWTTIWTTNAPTGGVFQFQDDSAPTPAAYYRLMWNGN